MRLSPPQPTNFSVRYTFALPSSQLLLHSHLLGSCALLLLYPILVEPPSLEQVAVVDVYPTFILLLLVKPCRHNWLKSADFRILHRVYLHTTTLPRIKKGVILLHEAAV